MKVLVIGGGAAGMMAAISAAQNGAQVTLIEKNEKLGKKIYITGKGRCNVTNDCEVTEFLENVITNKKFLMSALYTFSPYDLMEFLKKNGLKIKTERGNRVFPESDKASDVTKTLEKVMQKLGVKIVYNANVFALEVSDNKIENVVTDIGKMSADKYILCTGGISYPTTGSDGAGLKMVSEIGHNVVKPTAGLVGLKADSPSELAGLALKNVKVKVLKNDKVLHEEFGEMLFTHHGVSGPTVLTLSSKIN
ncbi:MAG: aminoacetone oxidase family FAD-binding enzyme, partial [Clostridia bacterium]|nr:aminoacetone oxidase family FAD-binding enzyme [Clostridia bacterium]